MLINLTYEEVVTMLDNLGVNPKDVVYITACVNYFCYPSIYKYWDEAMAASKRQWETPKLDWKDYYSRTPEERTGAGYWDQYVGIPDKREWNPYDLYDGEELPF